MASSTVSSSATTPTEQLLWKIVRAATALKSATEHWQHCQRRSLSLRRHIRTCSATATALHKTSAYATTFGAAAKVAGGVTTALGVVSKVSSLTSLGCRLWKVGCGAKLAGLGGRVVAEVWERGLKDTLTSYLSHLTGFLQSTTLFRAVLEEIEILMPAEFEPARFMPLLLLVCPEELFPYASHILKLFISSDHYSALYDFSTMALSSFGGSVSLPLNILHEVESYHVSSVLSSLPKSLAVAASVLHVGKEVVDMVGGLQSLQTGVQSHDFQAVRKVLQKLRHASVSLADSVREVPLLSSLVRSVTQA